MFVSTKKYGFLLKFLLTLLFQINYLHAMSVNGPIPTSSIQGADAQVLKRSINTTMSRLPNCPKSCLCMEVSQSDPAFFQDPYASYTPAYLDSKSAQTSSTQFTTAFASASTSGKSGTVNPSASTSTQVICSNTDLKILPRNLPANTIKLDLSQNEISFIPTRAFEGLPIRTLILDDNEIREIKPYAFIGMNQLAGLLMKNNPLDVLGQNSMSGINGTRTINLGSNHIDRIEREAFEDTQNVEFIDLSENPLTYVKTKAFRGLKNVSFLVFSSSGLKNLEPGCFDGLENVNHIIMTRVPLSNFEPNTFRGLKNVDDLEIRFAKVHRIKDYAFRDSYNIRRLTLSQINLEQLDKRAFSGLILKSVEYTPMRYGGGAVANKSRAYNALTSVPRIKHVKLLKMEQIDLSQNKLTFMHALLFADFANVVENIDITQNHILCACNMSWVRMAKYFYSYETTVDDQNRESSVKAPATFLYERLRGQGISEEQALKLSNITFRFNKDHISQLKCHKPLHLRGKPLVNVDFEKEFGCDPSDPVKFAEDLQKLMTSAGKMFAQLPIKITALIIFINTCFFI